jgi:hypothetical protein
MGNAERNATITIITELLLKNKKKPRLVWNIFFGAMLAFFLILYIYSTVYILGGLSLYEENTRYIKYDEGFLYTEHGEYEIETEEVDISIDNFIENAKIGDDIKIKVSKLNGELYEIQKNGIVLYQIPLIPIAIWIQQPMFISLMGICIFGLVVTNLKKPKGQLKKLQRELNIY